MDEAQQEYDRFGPWAIEVTEADSAPPLFRPHLTRAEPALLGIEAGGTSSGATRAPALPLDYLVCLHEDDLTVLQRVGQQRSGSECRLETVRYQDVQYLRVSQGLLRGTLHLGLIGRPLYLPYNTVSE